ncbi:hypothetical protein QZH41_015888, partial [Actinostola sp. cb2023]
GAKAFDDIDDIIERVGDKYQGGMTWSKQLIQKLKLGKRYLKGDYKVHVSPTSRVPDHCRAYALGHASDPDYVHTCEHVHDLTCDRCNLFSTVVNEIESALDNLEIPDQEREEMKYVVAQSKKHVEAWKAHLLRSINQDAARLDILDTLDEKSVLVVLDWAMKFLPRKYRESQADWFGKRGISWHVSVAMRKLEDQTQMLTFIHIFQSCSQDSTTVLTVIEDVIRQLKDVMPEIKSLSFRQDNAGCYHSASTLVGMQQLAKKHQVRIRMDFSDPQGGKGPCDRKAATVKNHMRVFLNSGHDIENADQVKTAIESNGGIAGVRVMLCGPPDLTKTAPVKWEGVSLINNFVYEEHGMMVWRAYGVGPGKSVSWSNFDLANKPSLSIIEEATDPKSTFCDITSRQRTKPKQSETASSSEYPCEDKESQDSDDSLFPCPEEGCIQTFRRYSSLTTHLDSDKHKYVLERETLFDKAMINYASYLEHGESSLENLLEADTTAHVSMSGEPILPMGWALKTTTTRRHRLTENQKRYLTDVFLLGEQTGRKADPNNVSKSMRKARNTDGSFLFLASDYLTAQQITSFFSRLSAKKSVSPDIDDATAEMLPAIEEREMELLRQEVLSEISIQHPVTYDTYNICEMAAASKLSKFSVAMLQDICNNFQLDISSVTVKRKKPYIDLLTTLVKSCSCQG